MTEHKRTAPFAAGQGVGKHEKVPYHNSLNFAEKQYFAQKKRLHCRNRVFIYTAAKFDLWVNCTKTQKESYISQEQQFLLFHMMTEPIQTSKHLIL